jgi:hypothetical protein
MIADKGGVDTAGALRLGRDGATRALAWRQTHHRRYDSPGVGHAAHGLRRLRLAHELLPGGNARSIVGGTAREQTPTCAAQDGLKVEATRPA